MTHGVVLECPFAWPLHLRVSRRGLSGFVNGEGMSALADSGADHNVITYLTAKEMGLKIEDSPASFILGNSKPLRSFGE